MTINIYNSDCLTILKTLPNDSVDVTITSPPYNMNLRIRNGKYCSRQIVKELTTKYVNYSDNLSMDDYYRFNKSVIGELLRISDTVFYNVQFLTGNKRALYKLIGDFSDNLKEFIVWDKVNAEPAIGEGVLNSRWEAILVFQKDSDAISRKFKNAQFDRGTMQNLLQIKREKSVSGNHGATFPTSLIESLIMNFTKPNDTILDPFMGTGTTGVVCSKTGRNFIGIEIDNDYFNLSQKRLQGV